MEPEVLIIKPAELFLKSPAIRSRFEKELLRNVKAYLKQKELDFEFIQRDQSRIFVYTDDIEDCFGLKNVFGIVTISAAVQVGAELDTMRETALQMIQEDGLKKTNSFAVRAKRVTKELPMNSQELAGNIGAYIQEKTKAKIDLKHPDKQVFVEVMQGKAFIFTKVIRCYGGLPVGTQGKVVCLMNDSEASKKAAWHMMKRGCEIIPVHIRLDEKVHLKFLKNCEELQEFSIGHRFKPNSVRLGSEFSLKAAVIEAEKIAKENNAKAIILGKTPGLKELKEAQNQITLPILAPLTEQ